MGHMKKTLSDNLLFASRSLLVLVFVVHLTVVVVGYSLLPDKIVTRPYLQGDELAIALNNPFESKEFFLSTWTIVSSLIFLLGLLPSLATRRNPKTGQSADYWNLEENFVLRKNIYGIWRALFCGTMILYLTLVHFQYFHINLSQPPSGELTRSGMLFVPSIFLAYFVLLQLTLFLVKRYRERCKRLPDAVLLEQQV